MAATRSRSRMTEEVSRDEPAAAAARHLPAASYTVQCWQQRTLCSKRNDTISRTPPASGASPSTPSSSSSSVITSELVPSSSDALTLICRTSSLNMREYVVESRRPLLTSFDYAMLFLSPIVLLYPAIAGGALFSLLHFHGILALLPLLLVLLHKAQTVTSESVLCVRSLGLQLRTTYLGGRQQTRFLSLPSIESVVVHEAITMYRLVDLLCVVLRANGRADGKGRAEATRRWDDKNAGGKKVVVLFRELRPRQCVLRVVYRGVRSVLYGEPE